MAVIVIKSEAEFEQLDKQSRYKEGDLTLVYVGNNWIMLSNTRVYTCMWLTHAYLNTEYQEFEGYKYGYWVSGVFFVSKKLELEIIEKELIW